MKSTVHFFGGVGSVTGANFMLESGSTKILIDCGLVQGSSFAEETNYAPFAYEAGEPSHLFVTHVHIDHIGRIPKLVRDGFKGRIISTEATKALAEPLLMDAQQLLASDAEKTNREPLYEKEDIVKALSLWEGVKYQDPIELPEGFIARFLDAGHILGSGMVEIVRDGRKIIFTGDLGNDHSKLVGPTENVVGANYLVMESVYGDKKQTDIENREELLEDIIEDSVSRGGVLMIPAFSTERTQELLFDIDMLLASKKIPSLPVYLDSPLALKITEVFSAYPSYFREAIKKRMESGEKLFEFKELTMVHTPEESRALHTKEGPMIIMAGSGMSQGGRMLSHEARYLGDPKNTLLIVGYQSAGSLGRVLLEGVKDVTIHKQKIKVKAVIEQLHGYSAHRDTDGLQSFVHEASASLDRVFVTMGEPKSSMYLAQRIRDYMGVEAVVPEVNSKVELSL